MSAIQLQPVGEGVGVLKASSPLVQTLTAIDVWQRLTPKQRDLVAACRVPYKRRSKDFYKRWMIRPQIDAPAVTLASLHRKGVVDERGVLTTSGVYAALWQGCRRRES